MALKDLLPTTNTQPTGPKNKKPDNRLSGATQQQPQSEGEQISMLGKALSGFGKALETPGFRKILGELGATISGPGTFGERLGTTSAGINQRMIEEQQQEQQAQVLQQISQGEMPSAEALGQLEPEAQGQLMQLLLQRQGQQQQARLAEERLGLQKLQGETYARQVELMETPEERAKREQSNIALEAHLRDRSDPTPWQPVMGADGLYMANTATGETVRKVEFPTDPSGGMTPAQVNQMHEDYLKLAIDLAQKSPEVQKFGKMIVDAQGQPQFQWTDPKAGREALNKIATEYLSKFNERGMVPESFTSLFDYEDNDDAVDKRLQINQIRDEYWSGPLTTERYEAAQDSIYSILGIEKEK